MFLLQDQIQVLFKESLESVFDQLEPSVWDSARAGLARVMEVIQSETEEKSHGLR